MRAGTVRTTGQFPSPDYTVVVYPADGPCPQSAALAEAIRLGTAPAAIVLAQADDIVLLGAIVDEELYGKTCPVLVIDPEGHAALRTGMIVEVTEPGIRVDP